jgi:hypothetical protein
MMCFFWRLPGSRGITLPALGILADWRIGGGDDDDDDDGLRVFGWVSFSFSCS